MEVFVIQMLDYLADTQRQDPIVMSPFRLMRVAT